MGRAHIPGGASAACTGVGYEVQKQDPHINPWSVEMLQDVVQSHADRPVCPICKLKGPVMSFW